MIANPLRQYYLIAYLIFFISGCVLAAVAQTANTTANVAGVDTINPSDRPLGKQLWYLSEDAGQLSWSQALVQLQQQNARRGDQEVLTLGLGVAPVWLYLSLDNNSENNLERQLLIGSPWLDQIDIYLFNAQEDLLQIWHAGDMQEFGVRNKATPGFLFPLSLIPGNNQVLIRIATPDPMILPVFLLTPQTLENKVAWDYYSYGLSYGYLLAFIAFNIMLYFSLRDNNHLLYAIYLIIFMLTNIAYTGHGYAWLWPTFIEWQHWVQPILIVSFGVSGLLFSMHFLTIRDYSYRLYRLAIGVMALCISLLLLCILLQQKTLSLVVTFGFMAAYTLLMLSMGIAVFVRRKTGIGYYLCAAVAGVVGVSLTSASVWGFIPYAIGFRAVEIGMLLEATLLALALAAQIRQVQQNQHTAEQLASTDPLTGINNRRAFYLMAPGLWSSSLRYNHALSMIMLDIDHFKQLNDTHGHICGDQVLVQLAKFLQQQARQSDVIARWGGEEFLILLPKTNAQEAQQFAERVRKQFLAQEIIFGTIRLSISASFGVTERRPEDTAIDEMIERADAALYQAKHAGRNCTRTIVTNNVI